MTPKILVTGGCGFFGHHFVEHVLKNTSWDVAVLDSLNYASAGFDRLRDIGVYDSNRVSRFTVNIEHPFSIGLERELGDVKYIAHIAAETHVDNSIVDPRRFVLANVLGTCNVLEFARRCPNLQRFAYFSTDEVFGPAAMDIGGVEAVKEVPRKRFLYHEWDRYNSTNPYSATKAGGEELCLAYANTYGLPIIITHCMNLFGERQHPEKYIPLCVKSVINGDAITVHADKDCRRPGSRFYLHARNGADALLYLLSHPRLKTRDKYNIVGDDEVDNLDVAERIARLVGKPLTYKLVDFHGSRPGHDLRYGLDGIKLYDLGWRAPVGFDESLERTVKWFLNNERWLFGDNNRAN